MILRCALVALILILAHHTAQAVQEPQEPAQAQEAACQADGPLPAASCTPGAIDPRVTQENLRATICLTGYSARMRPPVTMTNRWKLDRMVAYGATGEPRDYEGDHLISIELGGDPGAVRHPETAGWVESHWRENIWPQEWIRLDGLDAHAKDRLENYLHRAVCDGQIPLAQAQAEISRDWVSAYDRYVGPEAK